MDEISNELLPMICLTFFAFLALVYATIRLICSNQKKEKKAKRKAI